MSSAALAAPAPSYPLPAWFVPQALCVHSGWQWSARRPSPGVRPEYRLAGRWWFRTWDVPDGVRGGSGEGAWTSTTSLYGGGMQFMLGTYNRAAALSRGRLPSVSTTGAIAALPPAAQLYAAFLIVQQDGGSWREWPLTSRACGLR